MVLAWFGPGPVAAFIHARNGTDPTVSLLALLRVMEIIIILI
jgi:hypothetical protein